VPRAVFFGCAGPALSAAEQAFFRDTDPLGFILFARNVETPDQVAALCEALRGAVERPDAPILIDQEGGRVQRLKPPHWRQAPPAAAFGQLAARDPEAGRRAVFLNHRLIAAELHALGIDVDCAPCLDVPVRGAHDVIGDRAYGKAPDLVAFCGAAAAEGLMAGGVLPVIKHLPGHGRAGADSHHALPRVEADLGTLVESDFRPFRALSEQPLGMTAHIVYDALDPDRPATQSPAAIGYIRREMGFDGLLMTDDLSMRALSGGFAERARLSLDAGCDTVLHCNGDPGEMAAVAEAVGPLGPEAERRWRRAASLRRVPDPLDTEAALDELSRLVG
jgi:beta-N-acetylhexosaminidase